MADESAGEVWIDEALIVEVDEGGAMLTSHGLGGTSVEELNRPGVNFKISRSGQLSYLGKQVDVTLHTGEALVAIDKKTLNWSVRAGSHDTARMYIHRVKSAVRG